MTARKTRVLFVAWGHSIHGERRIGLFTQDPSFEVGVVANFNYAFANATNYLLTAGRSTGKVSAASAPDQADATPASAPPISPLKRAYRKVTGLPLLGAPLHEAVTSARDFRLLRQAVNDFAPDVIFLQTLMYPCYLALFLPARVPQMCTFWNGDVVWWAKLTGAEKVFKKQIVTRGARRMAAITVNSQAAFDACLRYGTARERVNLIRYPGIDTDRFFPTDKAAAKQRFGWSGPVILAPRGPVAYQNLDSLIRSAPAVLGRFPGAKFVFLDPTKQAPQAAFAPYRALAEQLGVAHAMEWRGNVAHADLPAVYNASDVVVSISGEDSLPNTMLEAMACRVPLVVGDIAPIREWITHGQNGLAVPPKDPRAVGEAIVRLLANHDKLGDRLSAAAARMVEERAAGKTQIPLVKELVHRVANGAR